MIDALQRMPELERRRWFGVGLCSVLYLFHLFWFSSWLIEDAAISMAYARNAAAGHGFVTNPGGGWVEGFSNPTWTLLLTATTWLGLSPWMTVKVVGGAMGLATLPLAYLWARRTAPDAPGMWPVLAPLGLAMSTPFALWSVAGLENPIFNLLLAAGAVGVLRDGDRPSFGGAGVFLGLLAFSRPEAPMYAGWITLVALPAALRTGGVRWLAGFFIASAGPFLAWHAWRYWAFAWPFPNTYYAKQTADRFAPLAWDHHGWAYVRRWALWSMHGPLLPLFAFGQSGLRGVRTGVALVLTGVLLGVLMPGITVLRDVLSLPDEPEWIIALRVGVILLCAIVFPLLGLGREGQRARLMAWGATCCALFFAVYTGGDWMRGARWMSMASVPLAVLLADGARTLGPSVAELLGAVRRGWQRTELATGLLALPILGAGVVQTVDFLFGIETTPFDVRRRVLYINAVAARLALEHVSLLEVDMGAHMMWSGFELIDLAGLCDVPMARHHFHPQFIDEYIGDEHLPTFAHLHGGWDKRSGVSRRPWFRPQYIEIPGYGHSRRKFHIGNHVRRDLLEQTTWKGETTRRTVFGPLVLEGLDLPSPEVHPGGRLQIELGWSITKRPPGFRALVFLTDGKRVVVRDLPPAYDWLAVPRWRRRRVVLGTYAFDLPDDLDPGRWSLGMAIVGDGPKAEVLAADTAATDPVFMAGEVRWEGVVTIESRDQVVERADSRVERAAASAAAGDCEGAEQHWHGARHHLATDDSWQEAARTTTHAAIGICWAKQGATDDDVEAIRRAVRYAPGHPEVHRIRRELADRWEAEGDAAWDTGDDEGAWTGWSRAIQADPARSWLRRKLEEHRAIRLATPEDP